jgi:hypothetical protein
MSPVSKDDRPRPRRRTRRNATPWVAISIVAGLFVVAVVLGVVVYKKRSTGDDAAGDGRDVTGSPRVPERDPEIPPPLLTPKDLGDLRGLLVGRWKSYSQAWDYRFEYRADGTYTHRIKPTNGQEEVLTGTWEVVDKKSGRELRIRLDGRTDRNPLTVYFASYDTLNHDYFFRDAPNIIPMVRQK